MTQSGVSAFARLARRFALSAVLLFASAGALAAQTGKLEGKVRDQAGAPIQSAQVFIVGTAFSALTNAQGYYFINNVPAGTIALRGAFIGYKKTEIEGVKILAGQTITQDIQLERATVATRHPRGGRGEPTRWCPATKSRPSSASTASSPRTCRSTAWARCCSCSRASWPKGEWPVPVHPRRPQRRSGDLRRRRRGPAGQPGQRLRGGRYDGVEPGERLGHVDQQRRRHRARRASRSAATASRKCR